MASSIVKYLSKKEYSLSQDNWHWQMRHQIRTPMALVKWLETEGLYAETHPHILGNIETWSNFYHTWDTTFRFGASPYYLQLADWKDPFCPILRQIIPSSEEFIPDKTEIWDPLAEEEHSPLRGLTHRYPDRVLWYLSHSCAIYCRFCMRKRKVSKPESAPKKQEWEDALDYIAKQKEVKEVILSGGDPLSLEDKHIRYILSRLREIKHLYSIRVHTRMPATLAMRITEPLARIFREFYPITLVTHFNHKKEVSPLAQKAIRLLRNHGVDVLNQAVLLRGINDTTCAQEELNLTLLKAGAKPYYLHRCDEVPGTKHLRVPVVKGVHILEELRGRNPGISLPRYVVDLPGGGGKVPLEPNYILSPLSSFSNQNKKTSDPSSVFSEHSDNHKKDQKKGKKIQSTETSYVFKNWLGKKYTIHEYSEYT